jgi:acyl transferase domain-containing protein/NADP-dependent 3-hydroxy acid dehydrogenase YdfG
MTPSRRPRLAIVGVSALFPGSRDAGAFWRNILTGADLLTDVPPTHWLIEDWYDPDPTVPDKVYAKRGGFLPQVQFDAGEWGVPPKIMKVTDTSQLLALMAADQVLRDAAGGRFAAMDRSRISVILGVTSAQELACTMAGRLQKPVWLKALREHGVPEPEAQAICARIAAHFHPWEESTFPGLLGNVVAGRIANRLNLGGTNCVVDAACASAFGALAMAAQELYLGDSDLVITGGVDTINDVFTFECFSKTPALSPSGDCRPFSDAADGTMLGEGLGMFALRRLEDAERDGDPIYAVLCGLGTSSDGRAKSVYAPVPKGQLAAVKRAQQMAGFDPRSIELVEAHGTGTKAGDAAEFEGLAMAFPPGESEPDRQWCALGSVKSQIGHTKAAAGAAGMFKAVMALRHKVLPPTIKVDRPNPNLNLEASAFYLNTVARPWISGSSHPRRAAVSSFGFGGSNYHLLFEEYSGPGNRAGLLRTLPAELIVLCGGDGREVAAQARKLAAGAGALAWTAWSSQSRFAASAPARLALVVAEGESWGERLERAATRIESAPDLPFELPDGSAYGLGPAPSGLALLFPGQGSQYVGMGADLALHFPAAREVWDRAADLLPGLERLVYPPPRFEDSALEADDLRLRETRWAQPAIGCASAAMLALLRGLGIEPTAVGGHSFGEVTALHAAGVFDEAIFLGVAQRRGQLMAEAGAQGEPGAMSAVLASKERIGAVLGSDAPVVLANLNAPEQTVISGTKEAVTAAEAALLGARIRVYRLPVSCAFHSPLVAASAGPLGAFLKGQTFRQARIPVYSGESTAPYEPEADRQRLRLGRQLANPVNFSGMVAAMADAGVHTFLEVGPGAVLSGLVDQILADRPHLALPLDARGCDGVVAFLRCLARLAALGVPMGLGSLWEGYRIPGDPSAVPRPLLPIPICGSNDKLYPPPGGAAALPPPNPAPPVETLPPAAPSPRADETRSGFLSPRTSERLAFRDLPPPAEPVASLGPEWLQAWREVQQQTSSAHETYLRAMDNSQQRLVELATARAGRMPVLALPEADPARTVGFRFEDGSVPGTTGRPVAGEAASAGNGAPVGATDVSPSGAWAVPPPAPLAVPAASPAPVAPPRSTAPDLQALMLSVVAEKTGYPAEMLNPAMELEAELGIDSIKRVEILAAIQEQVPDLPPVDAARMGAMRTLAEIAGYLAGLLPDATVSPVAGAVPSTVVPSTVPEPVAAPGLGRSGLELVPAPSLGMGRPGIRGVGEVAVTTDGAGVAEALVAELQGRGIQARVVDSVPATARAVVFLGGLRQELSAEEALAVNREAFQVARVIAPAFAARGGLFVTVQDTGGGFGLTPFPPGQALLAGLSGLVKTAGQEWPEAVVAAIDLERGGRPAADLARVLAEELLSGGPQLEVGLAADGERRTLRSAAAPLGPGADAGPIGPGDVVVASGGARGVTAACMVEWARRTGARFVLLGRSPLEPEPACCEGVGDDAGLKRALLAQAKAAGVELTVGELGRRAAQVLAGREIRATLQAIARAGGKARYRSVDVREPGEVEAALAGIRAEWGPIAALVHGAGILADKPLAELDEEAFQAVFATKVAGLRALLAATARDPLKVICLFSSVSARCGNAGQAGYAMANEVLNKMAQAESRRRGGATRIKALNWGPWEAGMVSTALAARFRSLGVPLVPVPAGARMFADEMAASGQDGVEWVLGGELRPEPLAGKPQVQELEVHLDQRSHGFLGDHRIGGAVVVPMALVAEWFCRAAAASRPELMLSGLRDLRVLRPLKLEALGAGQTFKVRCTSVAGGPAELELAGMDGTPHYRARAEMTERTLPLQPWPGHAGLAPWNGARIYGDTLFHGPAFQVIDAVDGVGAEGIQGRIHGVLEAPWPASPWRTDPLAIDSALQLAMLWARQQFDLAVLPMGLGALILGERALSKGPVRVVATCRRVNGSKILADAQCLDSAGYPLAELRGMELVLRPDWKG